MVILERKEKRRKAFGLTSFQGKTFMTGVLLYDYGFIVMFFWNGNIRTTISQSKPFHQVNEEFIFLRLKVLICFTLFYFSNIIISLQIIFLIADCIFLFLLFYNMSWLFLVCCFFIEYFALKKSLIR